MDSYFAHTVLRAVSLPSFGIIVQFIRHTTAKVLECRQNEPTILV